MPKELSELTGPLQLGDSDAVWDVPGAVTFTNDVDFEGDVSLEGVDIAGFLNLKAGGVPAGPTATGTAGDVRIDGNHIYFCTATNTWKRAELSTWT